MEITRRIDPRLAALAWCAVASPQGATIEACVGERVECTDHHIVEGAWSGAFGSADFDAAPTFTGTGCIARADHVVVCTPTHTLAPVYSLRKAERLWLSNSLIALLLLADERLAVDYPHYDSDVMSIVFGAGAHVPRIPVASGLAIELHYFENLRIGRDLRMQRQPKSQPPPFDSFTAYDVFIAGQVAAVIRNAADPQRGTRYAPLATVSSGYDSPACAVWARRAGATEAVTITEARGDFEDTDDSGKAIGECLGLKVIELSRQASRRAARDDAELEVLCTGYGGDDIIWIGAEPLLAGRLLLTGYHGDKIWSCDAASVSTNIKRGDPSGGSMLEFRLSAGFLNLPVPFIGCTRHPEIRQLSVSDEMKPWRIGGNYDRPLPRRVVEQAGVARSLFGQTKKAVALPFQGTDDDNPPLEAVLDAAVLAQFRDDLDRLHPGWRHVPRRTRLLRKLSLSTKVGLLAQRLGLSKLIKRARWRYRHAQTAHHYLTAWAANTLVARRLKRREGA